MNEFVFGRMLVVMILRKGEPYTRKGSRFVGFFCEVGSADDFKAVLGEIQKEHRKASHFCWAYVIDESSPLAVMPVRREKYSNGGEPGGVGSALVNLLRQGNFTNRAVVVVRYFGGVLLGAGNLIRAYAAAAKAVLK